MQIIIDDTWCQIHIWKDGRIDELLLSIPHSDHAFHDIILKILTESQWENYAGNEKIVFTLSQKKEAILLELIKQQKFKK